MTRNRYVNKYRDDDYPSGLEVLVFTCIAVVVITTISMGVRHFRTPQSPDCSKCHSVEFHETKKNVQYLIDKGYKEPTKWIKSKN